MDRAETSRPNAAGRLAMLLLLVLVLLAGGWNAGCGYQPPASFTGMDSSDFADTPPPGAICTGSLEVGAYSVRYLDFQASMQQPPVAPLWVELNQQAIAAGADGVYHLRITTHSAWWNFLTWWFPPPAGSPEFERITLRAETYRYLHRDGWFFSVDARAPLPR